MKPLAIPPDWPNRAASRHVASRPHLWHVQVTGDGPDVLLLHGAGGAGHSWRGLVPLLAGHYRLIVPDLPGQGFTTLGARQRCGLDPMAEDLARLLAAQGWHPRAVIGHSAGAALALRLAETLPEPPRAMVGINAALSPFEGVAGLMFPLMARALAMAPFLPQLAARAFGTPEGLHRLIAATGSVLDPAGHAMYLRLLRSPDHIDAALAMMAQWKLDGLIARLPGITLPALLIAAAGDRTVPARVSRSAAERLPAGEYLDLPRHGHLVQEEAPEEVAAPILGFLARQGL